MFELKIEVDKNNGHIQQLNILKNTFESIASLVEGLNISFHPHGIQIQTMDARNVCYCEFHLSSQIFSSYRCDRDLIIGIKLKGLLYSLRNIKMDELNSLTLSCNDENEDIDKLNVSIDMKGAKVTYGIKLYQFESENYDLPEMDFLCEVKIPVMKFLMAAKSLDGDYVDINIKKEQITFSSEGENINSKYDIYSEDVKIVCSEPMERQIAIKYINCIMKGASLVENVEIMIGKNTAVVFTLNLMGMGHLSYYIAPNDENIEEEEEE